MRNNKVIVCSEINRKDWKWISNEIPEFDWQFYTVKQYKNRFRTVFARTIGCLKAVLSSRHADVLVTHGPYIAFYCSFLMWLLRVKKPHVTYSFNFAELPTGFALWRMEKIYKYINCFVVSSSMERALYAQLFNIPIDHIDFVLWGISEPAFEIRKSLIAKPYVSAIGGNARDYETFMMAMAALPEIPAIAVMRPANLTGLNVPANVKVLVNIPKDEALSVLVNSFVTVLPLKTTQTPCGHVTLVVAMRLGIPCVVSDSLGIRDYVRHGETGLICDVGNVESLKQQIQSIFLNKVETEQISLKAKKFAKEACSQQNYVKHIISYVEKVKEINC